MRLEPLVYEPGPQNEADPEKWQLRPPAAILGLRICDPAVGSGAILTAAGRYLADRLIESVVQHGSGEGPFATGSPTSPMPPEEQVVLARREIVDHCLYGVDKNPVAAEMAKLSLWLTTMARERPFTFLDHAIQVGDSLLGITDLDSSAGSTSTQPSARAKPASPPSPSIYASKRPPTWPASFRISPSSRSATPRRSSVFTTNFEQARRSVRCSRHRCGRGAQYCWSSRSVD